MWKNSHNHIHGTPGLSQYFHNGSHPVKMVDCISQLLAGSTHTCRAWVISLLNEARWPWSMQCLGPCAPQHGVIRCQPQ